jgi:protein O-GlcNAc transferase
VKSAKPAHRRLSGRPGSGLANLQRLQRLHMEGRWEAVVNECKRRLSRVPADLESHRLLGFALHKLERFEASVAAYQTAARIHPDDGEILANHAGILQERALHGQALELIQRVCELRPEHPTPWIMRSRCLYQMYQHQAGVEAANKAVALAREPDEYADAMNQRAIHRRELGETREAIQDCEALIRLRPDHPGLRTNHLLFLLSDPDLTPEKLSRIARGHGTAIEAAAAAGVPPFRRIRKTLNPRLRIGFLSPDFRVHSVMHFVEPLLARLDRKDFEVWSLYLIRQEDIVTKRARQLSDHFVSLAGLSHEECVRRLRELELDVVIDLAGHSASNGLPFLAARVAPVQVSWLGYPATTGMKSIDYKFTDTITDPEGAEKWYSERLFRMNTFFCCYRPMIRSPLLRYHEDYEVKFSPAVQAGHVTFGSCNNLSKLTDDVLRLWGQIISSVPNSKLLIEGKDLENPEFGKIFRHKCERAGIKSDRLILVGLDPKNQYLTYHRIDIALDPFPLTGGTTSCDALWMGVPLVSMEGTMFSSRMGAGLLKYIGRTEWLARDAEHYLKIAAGLAADPLRLNDIRMTVRQAIENSPVMDEGLFAAEFGKALKHVSQACNDVQAATDRATLITLDAPSVAPTEMPEGLVAPQVAEGRAVTSQGTRVSLDEAYDALQTCLDQAKTARVEEPETSGLDMRPEWRHVTDEAKLLLATFPSDPMALAVLAEVELAHGNESAARHYMNWAVYRLGGGPQAHQAA